MKLPRSLNNWTSLIGATIAAISLFMIVFLFVVSFFFGEGGSYLGIVIYMVFPAFMVIGLIFIPIGMLAKLRKEKRTGQKEERRWPYVDFNYYRHRNAFMVFAVGTTIFLLLSAVGSYEAYHYTESVEFCGTICHKVMEPEYVGYNNSPHARVACVECHVGSGASWYVKSKLSGLYQVYAVLANNYPRPIPTPVHSLRPARETCEKCHWPEKFYSYQFSIERSYLADEANTEWDVALHMKIGSSFTALGLKEGVHWHINPDVKVEYLVNPLGHRDTIPWVQYTNNKTGESYIYKDTQNDMSEEDIAKLEKREMDCMDCHNRPSHDYQTPTRFIDNAITAGKIPKDLPDIKIVAMDIVNQEYPTMDSAKSSIEAQVYEYYEANYEDLFNDNRTMIDQAISGIQEEFSKNIFPDMKVNWSSYPNHIGHLEFEGCFRCHNNRHSTEDGRVISMDCNLCHLIVAQGTPDTLQVSDIFKPLEFVHPNDEEGSWKEYMCSECHRELY